MHALFVVLAFCLVACGASVTSTAPTGATAQGAEAFVRRALTDGSSDETYYAPTLQAVLAENERVFPQDMMMIDYDPVCQCQDALVEPINLTATPQGANAFAVRVRNGQGAEAREWTIVTAYENGRWGVTDVIEDEGSFVHRITQANRCAATHLAQGQSVTSCGGE